MYASHVVQTINLFSKHLIESLYTFSPSLEVLTPSQHCISGWHGVDKTVGSAGSGTVVCWPAELGSQI